MKILTGYAHYRKEVLDEIEKRIGGKPKFKIDEQVIEYSYSRGHNFTVPARCLIESAIETEKSKRKKTCAS